MVRYLIEQGWPNVERRAKRGKFDPGDITGIPGVCVEVKGDRSNRLPKWKAETLDEKDNVKASFCFLVVRKEYKPVEEWDWYVPWNLLDSVHLGFVGDVEDWQWVRMNGRMLVELMRAQGY